MTKIPTNKTNNDNGKFSDRLLKTDLDSASSERQRDKSIPATKLAPDNIKQDNSHLESVGELIRIEVEPPSNNPNKSTFQKLKAKTAAALIGSVVMLPILAVGSATYYFGSQAINEQTILAKRSNDLDLAEQELARQQKLLSILSIATGATALLAGAIAASSVKRLIDSMSRTSGEITAKTDTNTQVHKFVDRLTQSKSQKDLLKIIVKEVRTHLKCDRAIVYIPDKGKYGTIIAESVTSGYSQWLNKTIEDYFEVRYFNKCHNGKIRAIDDINKVDLIPSHKEQLEAMEVKANLVAPIVHEGDLFGLLLAHQCGSTREWQTGEIEFLYQIAQKTGIALKNARLNEDLLRLQAKVEKENKLLQKSQEAGLPTQLLNEYSLSISERVGRAELLQLVVEQARKIIECDRVMVYLDRSSNGDVVAESVAPGYPKALNSPQIKGLFARECSENHRSTTKVIDNVEQASLASSDLETLESLSVKASLIVPIWQNEQFGLLIAHQCQQPRQWLRSQIDLFTQLALQLGLVLDRVALQEELDAAKNARIAEIVRSDNRDGVNAQLKSPEDGLSIANQATLRNLQDRIRSSIPPRLPMEEITIEYSEAVLEPIESDDRELDPITESNNLKTAPNLPMNQFVGDLSDLSDKISQQSSIVTDSFQKLAQLAKQLSEDKESLNRDPISKE